MVSKGWQASQTRDEMSMRTIASTFSTREEAEAASRRLQTLGIDPDRLELKFLADAGEFFISAKVTPDQVDAATKILKRPPRDEAPPPVSAGELRAVEGAAAPVTRDAGFEPEPRIAREASVLSGRTEAPIAATKAPPDPESYRPFPAGGGAASTARVQPSSADGDWSGLGRRTVIFCLVLLVAFVAGALIGLVA
jgi:hypothetical protein